MALEERPLRSEDQSAFNFSRAGLIAGDQIRALRTLDEQFARNLTHTLGAWLRSHVAITSLPAEQQVFSKFAGRTASGNHVLPLTMRTDRQQVRSVFALSLSLAPAIIDLLLGGSGRTGTPGKELTEIEEAVLGSVTELVLREWSTAWAPLGGDFAAELRERDGHGQRLMPLQERVVCSSFQVTLADVSGELSFCLPSAAVISTLRAVSHRRDRQRKRSQDERGRMAYRLRGAGVHATLHFPPMRLKAVALQNLQPGSLLPLPLATGVPSELRLGGVAVFRAEPVRSGEHRAARVVHALDGEADGGRVDE